jgi:hypothetical protein
VARQLGNIIHASCKLCLPDTAKLLLPRFLRASTLQHADPQALSNVLWASASLQLQLTAVELQQLLARLIAILPDATSQAVSNSLWAVATMQQRVTPQQLRQLLERFVVVLTEAKPQGLANTMWAVATMGQQLQSKQLQQLLERFVAVLHDATAQNVSNSLWAVATMKQQVKPQQLQQMLGRLIAVCTEANPQNVSNTLWAVARMGQQMPPQQLQVGVAAFAGMLPAATPQAVSNLLWACAKMQFLPLQLLQSLQQHPQQLQQLVAAAEPQELANMAWVCGELGYRGQLLPGALLAKAVELLQGGVVGSFTLQDVCNLCWSAAVLDLQQQVPQLLQLAAAASQLFAAESVEGLQQLYQVHLWLLDSQLPAPGQGLSGVLTQQQLQQCRACWEQQLTAAAKQQSSRLQQLVYAAVLQVPPDIRHQQPQSEQPTADKACLIDIAAVTASGVKVAIEVDGPLHFVQPSRSLSDATLYRN